MTIRLDECCSFGMMKVKGHYEQIQPAIFVNGVKIPQITHGGSFTYLGIIFTFDMNNIEAKQKLMKKLQSLLKITSDLKIRVQLKLKIFQLFIHSQISHELKQYDLTISWISQNLDAESYQHIKNWLKLPHSACVKEVTTVSKKYCGLGIQSFKEKFERLWLRKRYLQKNNSQPDINQIWMMNSNHRHTAIDSIIVENDSCADALKQLKDQQIQQAKEHFHSLELQGVASKIITENISDANIILWNKITVSLSQSLFLFCRKALLQVLPTESNLHRWKKSENPYCRLCNKIQSNLHVLSNCASIPSLERYKTRHDNILKLLSDWIYSSKPSASSFYGDLHDSSLDPIECVFLPSVRPDLILLDNSKIAVLELTICHEKNILKSRSFKMNKYKDINLHLQPKYKKHRLQVFTIEISVLGFISNLNDFCTFFKIPNMPISLKTEILKTVIINSYNIYCKRNSNL